MIKRKINKDQYKTANKVTVSAEKWLQSCRDTGTQRPENMAMFWQHQKAQHDYNKGLEKCGKFSAQDPSLEPRGKAWERDFNS